MNGKEVLGGLQIRQQQASWSHAPVMKKDEEVKKIFLTFYGAEGEAAAAQMKKLREQILDKMKNKDELAALRIALLRD